ncbi:aminopeptidase-like protein [Hypoxylon sp. FL0543]|nr:aminopeptidase-like protein [Hypoxylon sp. FL0543]
MKFCQLPLRQLEQHLKPHSTPISSQLTRRILKTRTSPQLLNRRSTSIDSEYNPRFVRCYTKAVPASNLLFGQPVHETHPHVLKPGQLTPGITAQEYHERRARLCQSLPPNSAVVLRSAELKYRSGAVFYPFRQESNFFYLTGFSEPESIAVLKRTGDGFGDYKFYLFCRPKDPKKEQWQGPWSGLDAARDVWNADKVGDIGRYEGSLRGILLGVNQIFTNTTTGLSLPDVETKRVDDHVNALRAVKSPAEIANMRHAGQASGRAFTEAMRRPWKYEKKLAAYLEHQYYVYGLDGHAYVPVVAGGSRANLIHYVLNNAVLNETDLVLVDSGGEYGYYVTDITRTWPIAGKFSQPQKDLYNAVLRAQRSTVSLCRASANVTLDKLHQITENALCDQLQQLGFDMSGDAINVLFPHHVGHYVGLDVHDVPGYPRNVVLKTGHCITVEPGIYVPDDERWPKAFRGMGIRIEDSVCVNDDSPLILTTEAVKEVDDIEALR